VHPPNGLRLSGPRFSAVRSNRVLGGWHNVSIPECSEPRASIVALGGVIFATSAIGQLPGKVVEDSKQIAV
jgi:hypothetical protein